jgi:hypothetical protein
MSRTRLDRTDIETLRKAVSIGFTSWDGDGWYVSKDHLGERGYDYDEAEAIFRAAQAILARLHEGDSR